MLSTSTTLRRVTLLIPRLLLPKFSPKYLVSPILADDHQPRMEIPCSGPGSDLVRVVAPAFDVRGFGRRTGAAFRAATNTA